MSEQQPEKIPIDLNDAYSVITPEDNRRLYAKWAASYESSFVEAKKYRYPRAIAELFDEVAPDNLGGEIVDVGCGTGLVASYLAELRPNLQIDGFDISLEMLDQARKKRRSSGNALYRNLIERNLTNPIASDSHSYDSYDGLVSAGTFTHGHLGPDALNTLIGLVRKEGWFLIGINAEHFEGRGFADAFAQMASSRQITEPIFQKIHVYEQGSPHFGDQSVTARFFRL